MMKWMLAPVLLAGCTGAPTVEPAFQAAALDAPAQPDIIGGTDDSGDPSVVLLFVHAPGQAKGQLCTASVITPRTLLTAAHCVDPAAVGNDVVFEAYAGPRFDSTRTALPAVAGTTFDPEFRIDNLPAGNDVGLVFLSAATNLKPLPIARSGGVELGYDVRAVGYGVSAHDGSGSGVKRQATATLDWKSDELFHAGDSRRQICHGDSGGPAFFNYRGTDFIVGLTTFVRDRSQTDVCYEGGYFLRVEAVIDWIKKNVR